MKIINITLSTILASSLLFSSQVVAIDNLTANVGLTSNYLWRGLEQSNGKPAVSGGIDYTADSGFYAGTWVSSADWADGMTYEVDIYAGYSGETTDFTYDVGFIQYAYPDSTDNVDFNEVYAKLTYGVFTFGYATLSGGKGVDFGDDSYLSIDADFEVAKDILLTFHLGKATDDYYAGEKFIDYGVNLTKDAFTLGLSKTDIENDDVKVFVSYLIDLDF
jgi:uncharacterized protein (TIGR02001 family)